MVVLDKKNRTCIIVDFAVPGDSRIDEKEKENIGNISRSSHGSCRKFGMFKNVKEFKFYH